MDFVARAKALLANKARIGLMILPLASAVPALATAITATALPTSNFSCDQNDGGTHTNCAPISTVQQLGVVNGLQGLKFFGPSSGSFTFSSNNNASGGEGVNFGTIGVLTGPSLPSGSVIPLSYHFNLTGSVCCGAITGWQLQFAIQQSGGGFGLVNILSPNQNFTGDQSGSSSLSLPNGLTSGVSTLVSSGLSIFYTNIEGFTATLTIPSQSLDFNPNPTNTPEPATAGLIGLGIALAGGYRLVRRRKGFVVVKESGKA